MGPSVEETDELLSIEILIWKHMTIPTLRGWEASATYSSSPGTEKILLSGPNI